MRMWISTTPPTWTGRCRRCCYETDLLLIPNATGHRLNPMVEDDKWTRLGIDATVPCRDRISSVVHPWRRWICLATKLRANSMCLIVRISGSFGMDGMIVTPIPAFYTRPQSLDDLICHSMVESCRTGFRRTGALARRSRGNS